MKINKKIGGLWALSVVLVGGVTGALAYYSAQAPLVQNSLTIKAGASNKAEGGTITEDDWDNITRNPDNGGDKDGDGILDVEQAQPGQTFKKDPKLTNGQNYNSYAYLRVKVPVLNGKLGAETTASVHDCVTYNLDTTNWELAESTVSTTVGTPSVYIYRYKGKTDPSDTKLANKVVGPGKTTQTLFTEITVQDFKEVTTDFSSTIDLTGALIQTDGFDDATSLLEAKDIFGAMDGGTYTGGHQA